MAYFRKIKAGLVKAEVDDFVGEVGNLFFDIETGSIRLSDGVTPGGIPVSSGGGGGGTYVLPTASTTVKGGVKIDGTTIKITNQVISGFSGNYVDLTNKPVIPTSVSQLVNDTGFLTAVSWNDITGKPTLSTVATSGSYADLLNKPVIPTVPTNITAFTNDAGYLTTVSWSQVTGKPTFATVATSGSYSDLTDKPFIPTDLSDLTDTSNVIDPAYSKRVDDTVAGIIYIGEAAPTSADSSPVWRIRKVFLDTNNNVDAVMWAADGTFTQIWDNHTSLYYA